MTTRATWIEDLAGRARRVGWTVRRQSSTGGYKITCPDGSIVPLHATTSDRNAPKAALRLLREHGLTDAETAYEKTREKTRREKIATDRASAAKKTAKLATRTTNLNRATGPYACPEEVDIDWYLTAHPAPWARWVIITPEQAATLLDKTNNDNRPLTARRVDRYQKVIEAKQWHLTHQGLAWDTTGTLQDGQHRLAAIARAGVAVPAIVFVGMPPENFKAIDEGLNRQVSQLFAKAGHSNTNTLASTIKLVIAYLDPNPRSIHDSRPTNETVYDTFATDPVEYTAAVTWARQHSRHIKFAPGVAAALHYLLRRQAGVDNPYVQSFLDGLANGLKPGSRIALDDDDPRVKLRQWAERKKEQRVRVNPLDVLSLAIRCWNYIVEDTRPVFLRWSENMPITPINICAPTGPEASDIPPLLATNQ